MKIYAQTLQRIQDVVSCLPFPAILYIKSEPLLTATAVAVVLILLLLDLLPITTSKRHHAHFVNQLVNYVIFQLEKQPTISPVL